MSSIIADALWTSDPLKEESEPERKSPEATDAVRGVKRSAAVCTSPRSTRSATVLGPRRSMSTLSREAKCPMALTRCSGHPRRLGHSRSGPRRVTVAPQSGQVEDWRLFRRRTAATGRLWTRTVAVAAMACWKQRTAVIMTPGTHGCCNRGVSMIEMSANYSADPRGNSDRLDAQLLGGGPAGAPL